MKVRAIILTKDERELIDECLSFYSRLLGAENVTAIDNGSTDPDVLNSYEKHRARGVDIRVDTRGFHDAVIWMNEHIDRICALQDSEFIMVLETDEFVVMRNQPYSMILPYLASLSQDVSVVKYGTIYESRCSSGHETFRDIVHFTPVHWDKFIVRTSRFKRMIQWCHHVEVTDGATLLSEELSLLHFVDIGFRSTVTRALSVLCAFHYVNPNASWMKQLHRCNLLVKHHSHRVCMHKIFPYSEYVHRVVAMRAFRTHAHRLPHSFDELWVYASQEDPEHAVILDAEKLRLHGNYCSKHAKDASWWDHLLYQPYSRLTSPGGLVRITDLSRYLSEVADVRAVDDVRFVDLSLL
jgi:hypothetical protein